jgi:predicted nucleic acid-binding protein
MISRILVDTGPLVAILSKRDQHHKLCVECLQQLEGPAFTCWPVLSEALWMLRSSPVSVDSLITSFDGDRFALLPMDESSLPWIDRFLRRYRKVGAQLADASLMYLAEQQDFETIFTLDCQDFSVYRLRGNRAVQLIP